MGGQSESNERLIEVWDGFVAAGRQVVRDLVVTEDELHQAAQFLQELGAQKFLVGLVDMAFATAASETHASMAGVHKANLEGPLHRPGAPVRPDGVLYEQRPSDRARFLTLTGRVYDAETGDGIVGAELDFWQTNEFGEYDLEGYNFRGILLSGDDGTYTLKTIVPEAYTMHEDDLIADLFGWMGRHAYRAAHIHLKVRVGSEEVLTTQFYDPGSNYLEDDVVTGAVRPDVMMDMKAVEGSSPVEYVASFDLPVTVARVSDQTGASR